MSDFYIMNIISEILNIKRHCQRDNSKTRDIFANVEMLNKFCYETFKLKSTKEQAKYLILKRTISMCVFETF